MWITRAGKRMSQRQLYQRFCDATAEELGRRVNPKQVRKIVATGVAVCTLEHIEDVTDLLDHTDLAMCRRHYILANKMLSGQRYLEVLRTCKESIRQRKS
jgi:site-specific recombinase XerC